MEKYTEAFGDKIVQVCILKYNSLKKTGKPKTDGEWTLLSCFVQEGQGSNTLKVVALGTGSKCIGAQQLPTSGDVLHDSHAEVVARRAFVLYLTQQVRSAANGHASIFQVKNGTFYLKPDIFFHFYTSHTPCGDASIFLKQEWPETVGNALKTEDKDAPCTITSSSPEREHQHSLCEVAETKEAACSTTPEGEHLHSLCEVAETKEAAGSATHEGEHLHSICEVAETNEAAGLTTPEGGHLQSLREVAETKETGGSTTPEGEHLHSLCEEVVSSSDTEVPTKKRKLQDLDERNSMQGSLNSYVGSTMKIENKQLKGDSSNYDEEKKITENRANNGNKVLSDTFRTGAKCVTGETPDPQLPGIDYHVTGVLRTKPGRGDPTLSMSCSDKIFKWTILGVQGALLMMLLDKPVYVSTIVIGQCPYSQEAMNRAIHGRFQGKLECLHLPKGFSVHTPALLQSHVEFPHSRNYVSSNVPDGCKLMPSPTSIIWSDTSIHTESQEVATNGRRLGCTKKNIGTPKGRVSICRKAISNQMLHLVKDRVLKLEDLSHVSYSDLKCYSKSYLQAWNNLRAECLPNWTEKPKHLKDFKILHLKDFKLLYGKPSI